MSVPSAVPAPFLPEMGIEACPSLYSRWHTCNILAHTCALHFKVSVAPRTGLGAGYNDPNVTAAKSGIRSLLGAKRKSHDHRQSVVHDPTATSGHRVAPSGGAIPLRISARGGQSFKSTGFRLTIASEGADDGPQCDRAKTHLRLRSACLVYSMGWSLPPA
jgi:hypothetical protein